MFTFCMCPIKPWTSLDIALKEGQGYVVDVVIRYVRCHLSNIKISINSFILLHKLWGNGQGDGGGGRRWIRNIRFYGIWFAMEWRVKS